MLLKSIALKNFRQFVNESIDFALGEDGKNVTTIIGENGAGKTSFAQAFSWCLYGETSFADKIVLNKKVGVDLKPGETAKVLVTLKLKHGALDYTLERSQVYKKDSIGKLKADNTVFTISYKDETGNTQFIKPTLCENEVKKILPKELSNYFFFDGERIEKLSKDISGGKKATDFAEAVKGLLGLNGMAAALDHLNPRSRNSVIGSYNNSYDPHSNAKVAELTKKINDLTLMIDSANERQSKIEDEKQAISDRLHDKEDELKQYEESAKLQQERERLEKAIETARKTREVYIKDILKDFNQNQESFFSAYLTKRAIELLSTKEFIGKDIPYIHSKTIEYLLKQGTCICGTPIEKGSKEYQALVDLINYLPPQSISTSIAEFKNVARTRVGNLNNLKELTKDAIVAISETEDNILGYVEDLNEINKTLSGANVKEVISSINAEIKRCKESLHRLTTEREANIRNIASWETDRKRADDERRELTVLDDNNKKIETYKMYAQRIYDDLQAEYVSSETEIREKLQDTINSLFKDIYAGGLSLTIDEKYHISVYCDELTTDIETSTAQSISVIFAFISGIIKMARENDNANLSTEPYPLVMDAPLSAFDKRRIKTVCETLPNTAEQVIIFIKDTDGDIAEEHMQAKIGSRHAFNKLNEFETVLE